MNVAGRTVRGAMLKLSVAFVAVVLSVTLACTDQPDNCDNSFATQESS